MNCKCYPANEKCPTAVKCDKPSRTGRLLCRLGFHRKYFGQRSYNQANELVFWFQMCRRHCGWADAGPNYRRPTCRSCSGSCPGCSQPSAG